MGHYERWASKRSRSKEPTVYVCPHCDFSSDLDTVWWHIDQHLVSTRQRRSPKGEV
jgi:hypothetical protein